MGRHTGRMSEPNFCDARPTLIEIRMALLLGLIVREAGKSFANAIAEVREAIDFLRYYAASGSMRTLDLRRASRRLVRLFASARGISRLRFSLARSPPRWRLAIRPRQACRRDAADRRRVCAHPS